MSDLTLVAKWKLTSEPSDSIIPAVIPATKTPTTSKFPFTDVSKSDWFYDAVKGAWENGLINGVTATTYQPKGTLTVAEAIKLASALHQMIKDGKVTLTNGRGYCTKPTSTTVSVRASSTKATRSLATSR